MTMGICLARWYGMVWDGLSHAAVAPSMKNCPQHTEGSIGRVSPRMVKKESRETDKISFELNVRNNI